MAKRSPSYLAAVLMFSVAAAVTYGVRSMPVRARFSADFSSFPRTISQWNGQDLDMAGGVKTVLNADSIMSRAYTSEATADALGLLVVYRRYGRRDFAHRPEMCYPASGWEIVSKGYTIVPYAGRDTQAREVIAERDGQREVIVYWFASGSRTEANFAKQQLCMALDRMRTQKYGWAFVRVNCPVLVSDNDTRMEIRRFLAAASPALVKALTTPPRRSASR